MSDPSKPEQSPARAAVASYTARSEAFYRVLTMYAIDGDDEALATWAHSMLSKAAESEAFDGTEQSEGGHEDELPDA